MTLKGVIFEDFVNYKKPSMVLQFPKCSFKCGESVCQNSALALSPNIECDAMKLAKQYVDNPITEAVVMQGLEPIDSIGDVFEFISDLRDDLRCDDDVVIYTGYEEEEISSELLILSGFKNIIVKFGRYIPNETERYDSLLGVRLASGNQYARKIS